MHINKCIGNNTDQSVTHFFMFPKSKKCDVIEWIGNYTKHKQT